MSMRKRAIKNNACINRPFKLVRVLILGAAKVGKTAVIRAITGKIFKDEYRPTIYDICVKQVCITGNLFTMLLLLKNTTFSTAIHRVSDIIQTVRIIVETSDTQLLDVLCGVNTEGKYDARQKYSMALEKKSRLIRSIAIKLPIIH